MTKKSILVAHSNKEEGVRLSARIRAMNEFDVIAVTIDLVETFAEVEDNLPDAVLISADLAAAPEFEVMHALFGALDVRWISISRRESSRPRALLFSTQSSGLFTLPRSVSDGQLAVQLRSLTRGRHVPPTPAAPGPACADYHRMILIGASTGGVDALLCVLRSFPSDCPPTLIVQHTGKGFGESLVSLLDRQCAPSVVLARSAMALRRGCVIVAAGTGTHLALTSERPVRAVPREGPAVSGHCPSVDALFQSALPLASRCVAALLTGMGRDGAEGLMSLRRAGAITIVQDKATSVIYGMPKAAMELGAADRTHALSDIGPALISAAQVAAQKPVGTRP